jgi:protein SCO1/2
VTFHDRLAKAVGRPLFWVVLVGLLTGVPLALQVAQDQPAIPGIFAKLPEFELVDQDGKAFDLARMTGRIWIADFIFTRCPTLCVALSERMSSLQLRLKNSNREIQLVSFSVDPEHDTPARLRDYAKRFHAMPWVWTFVTGALGAMETVVVEGFKIAMDKNEDAPADDIMAITHGSKFVLIDRKGRIRGYYDDEEASVNRMLKDAAVIANVEQDRIRTAM